jgi:hypothetical protein
MRNLNTGVNDAYVWTGFFVPPSPDICCIVCSTWIFKIRPHLRPILMGHIFRRLDISQFPGKSSQTCRTHPLLHSNIWDRYQHVNSFRSARKKHSNHDLSASS